VAVREISIATFAVKSDMERASGHRAYARFATIFLLSCAGLFPPLVDPQWIRQGLCAMLLSKNNKAVFSCF